ncbi:hypothetical protein B0H14DRAFT_2623304 [Mycena olivaceomarginata]|nr:hypothetical protein B0H14DRAFT_2623304 [Mycena olivaceomarginata]
MPAAVSTTARPPSSPLNATVVPLPTPPSTSTRPPVPSRALAFFSASLERHSRPRPSSAAPPTPPTPPSPPTASTPSQSSPEGEAAAPPGPHYIVSRPMANPPKAPAPAGSRPRGRPPGRGRGRGGRKQGVSRSDVGAPESAPPVDENSAPMSAAAREESARIHREEAAQRKDRAELREREKAMEEKEGSVDSCSEAPSQSLWRRRSGGRAASKAGLGQSWREAGVAIGVVDPNVQQAKADAELLKRFKWEGEGESARPRKHRPPRRGRPIVSGHEFGMDIRLVLASYNPNRVGTAQPPIPRRHNTFFEWDGEPVLFTNRLNEMKKQGRRGFGQRQVSIWIDGYILRASMICGGGAEAGWRAAGGISVRWSDAEAFRNPREEQYKRVGPPGLPSEGSGERGSGERGAGGGQAGRGIPFAAIPGEEQYSERVGPPGMELPSKGAGELAAGRQQAAAGGGRRAAGGGRRAAGIRGRRWGGGQAEAGERRNDAERRAKGLGINICKQSSSCKPAGFKTADRKARRGRKPRQSQGRCGRGAIALPRASGWRGTASGHAGERETAPNGRVFGLMHHGAFVARGRDTSRLISQREDRDVSNCRIGLRKEGKTEGE